jgi:hypothetical protein
MVDKQQRRIRNEDIKGAVKTNDVVYFKEMYGRSVDP